MDAEGLAHRVISVPVPQGNYSALTATDGALLWLDSELAGVTGEGRASLEDKNAAPSLVRFDLAKRRTTTIVEALDSYRLSGDGEKVVFVQDKQIRVAPADAKADEESGQLVKVDLDRIRVLLDPLSVWGQAFDEAWRLQRDFFWTEDMAGQDWDSVHARYRPIVDRLGFARRPGGPALGAARRARHVPRLRPSRGRHRERQQRPGPPRRGPRVHRRGLGDHRASWRGSPRTRWPPRR